MPDRAYSDSVNENLHDAVSAWFLGPQGENADMLKGLFEQAVNLQKKSRLDYYPEDGVCPFFRRRFSTRTHAAFTRNSSQKASRRRQPSKNTRTNSSSSSSSSPHTSSRTRSLSSLSVMLGTCPSRWACRVSSAGSPQFSITRTT
ncbi:hypothetical protein B0H14DRAFT_2719809 [Mycena olivaceomarginata]|nr:hypothetical protein B0H14DRAFT_2719809 [Mycena olivaceomarginata]